MQDALWEQLRGQDGRGKPLGLWELDLALSVGVGSARAIGRGWNEFFERRKGIQD